MKMDVIRPWIANRVTELLGFEDEVLINFIYSLLDGKVMYHLHFAHGNIVNLYFLLLCFVITCHRLMIFEWHGRLSLLLIGLV